MTQSLENEFGDKHLETGPKGAQFGPNYYFWVKQPEFSARHHCCLSKYTKSEKSNDSEKSRKYRKTPDLGYFGPILLHFAQF